MCWSLCSLSFPPLMAVCMAPSLICPVKYCFLSNVMKHHWSLIYTHTHTHAHSPPHPHPHPATCPSWFFSDLFLPVTIVNSPSQDWQHTVYKCMQLLEKLMEYPSFLLRVPQVSVHEVREPILKYLKIFLTRYFQ